jgi:antirestriction protein ArdC
LTAICATVLVWLGGEELVAELCAAFLCAEFAIDGELRHAGYIANWSKLLRDDRPRVFHRMQQGQAAADYLRGLAIAEPIRRWPADFQGLQHIECLP